MKRNAPNSRSIKVSRHSAIYWCHVRSDQVSGLITGPKRGQHDVADLERT